MSGCAAIPLAQQGGALKEYAALGDSYTAGAPLPETEGDSGCFRSNQNYPHLLAAELKIAELRDVSCGGANTAGMFAANANMMKVPTPAQLDAVTEDTDLVTVSIGANDFSLLGIWVTGNFSYPETTLPTIGASVTKVLEEAHKRAPDATVVYVGYPRLVDPGTSCPERIPLTPEQVEVAFAEGEKLNEALRQAAEDTDTVFIDVFNASKGHGICAKTPWIQGSTTTAEAWSYHPFARMQEAVAELVALAVTEQ